MNRRVGMVTVAAMAVFLLSAGISAEEGPPLTTPVLELQGTVESVGPGSIRIDGQTWRLTGDVVVLMGGRAVPLNRLSVGTPVALEERDGIVRRIHVLDVVR